MLQLISISKSYNKVRAVNDISFCVEKGEVLGLVGENGAGKSTTVAMIATLMKPDAGQILFQETDIVKHPEVIRSSLGYVPQDIALYETLTGADNLAFWARAYHIKRNDYLSSSKRVCDIIGFDQKMLKKKVKDYSGGMKRRLNIGVALMHHPELIIMDEPTAGIDLQSRNQILSSINDLSRSGAAVIYVGHYMEEVEKICDRILILHQGNCILNDNLEKSLMRSGIKITLEQLYKEKSKEVSNNSPS